MRRQLQDDRDAARAAAEQRAAAEAAEREARLEALRALVRV